MCFFTFVYFLNFNSHTDPLWTINQFLKMIAKLPHNPQRNHRKALSSLLNSLSCGHHFRIALTRVHRLKKRFFCRSKADPPPLEKGIFINAFSLKHFHRIRDFFFSSDCDNEKLTSVESWFKLCSTLNWSRSRFSSGGEERSTLLMDFSDEHKSSMSARWEVGGIGRFLLPFF